MMPQCSTGKCRAMSPLCSDPTLTTLSSGREGETPLLCHTISYPASISLLSELVDQCYHLFLCSLSSLVTDIAQSRVQFPLSVQSSGPERNRKLTLPSAAKILFLCSLAGLKVDSSTLKQRSTHHGYCTSRGRRWVWPSFVVGWGNAGLIACRITAILPSSFMVTQPSNTCCSKTACIVKLCSLICDQPECCIHYAHRKHEPLNWCI